MTVSDELRAQASQQQALLDSLRSSPQFDKQTSVLVAAVTAAVTRNVLTALADIQDDGRSAQSAVASVLEAASARNAEARNQATRDANRSGPTAE